MSDSEVVGLLPFVPATEFGVSFAFYEALGFSSQPINDSLAVMRAGVFGFLLQRYDATTFAKHLMLQLVVTNLDSWWERTRTLDLATKFRVQAPRAPEMQPWGLRVCYVFDPSGLLWHVIEDPS